MVSTVSTNKFLLFCKPDNLKGNKWGEKLT